MNEETTELFLNGFKDVITAEGKGCWIPGDYCKVCPVFDACDTTSNKLLLEAVVEWSANAQVN